MSSARLVCGQIRFQNRLFWRSPVSAFFSIILPLMMLVIFNAIFADSEIETPDGTWSMQQFYTGGLAAFAAVSATYTNLANTIPIRRDEGILKRWRGTPLPPWIYVAGTIGSAIWLALVGVTIMLTAGVLFYDLEVVAGKIPAALLTFFVGVGAFAALGVAIASLIPTAAAAPAIANATILPLAFISSVFVSLEDAPAWLETLGDVFPLKPFVTAFQDAFNPWVEPPGIAWGRLAVVVVWGVIGVAVALTRFRWEPAAGPSSSGRSRRGRRKPVGEAAPEPVSS